MSLSNANIFNAINNAWDRPIKERKVDWLGLEMHICDVLKSDMSDSQKIAACKELIDSFTRRGHFDKNEYLSLYEKDLLS